MKLPPVGEGCGERLLDMCSASEGLFRIVVRESPGAGGCPHGNHNRLPSQLEAAEQSSCKGIHRDSSVRPIEHCNISSCKGDITRVSQESLEDASICT
jgi:hypothetical protein